MIARVGAQGPKDMGAVMKALLIAGEDARAAAEWALEAGAPQAESPIGRVQ